jgi:ParB family transcriptional regulator, chromosome partitioning protein
MNRRPGLGRGLGSLIPPATVEAEEQGGAPTLTEVPVADVTPNPNQPRVHFDEESLAELAASIAQLGLLQPILVRRVDDGYQLIAGERRWRAARRAGLTTVPAVVRVSDDVAAVEEALVENLHRENLTALEEAAAYLQLIEEFNLTHDDVAKRIGKSRSSVTNTLRLLGLPPEVQRLLADGKLSAGHAKALLGTPDRALQERLANLAVDEGWSVRTTEDVVRNGGVVPLPPAPTDAPPTPTPRSRDEAGGATPTRLRPPGLLELEELLAAHLDTRVGVQMGSRRGKVSIEFADLEDLERIYRLMVE